ncbi:hypothetical protein MAR_018463, partial [Mya arenaria]
GANIITQVVKFSVYNGLSNISFKFLTFSRGNAIAHVERVTTESCRAKRCANTPVETLQTLSRSPSAAESITLSVEKLKLSDGTDQFRSKSATAQKARRSIQFQDHSYAVKNKSRSPNDRDKSRSSSATAPTAKRSILFEEHAYMKTKTTEVHCSLDTLEKETELKILMKTLSDIQDSHMQELDSQLSCFSGMKSFLFKKDGLSEDTFFLDAVLEMCKGCPLLAQCIFTALGKKISKEAMIATAATIYGMILHCRNKQVSGLQRLLTTVCIRYNADNKMIVPSTTMTTLLTHLNKVHLTLSEESKRKLIQDFGDKSENSIISAIAEGHDGKLNGDNLDIRVNTNDMRMDVTSRNKDYHFFATDFTLDRVNLDHLSKVTPNVEAVQARCFLPNDEEQHYYKKSLKILLGRELQKLDGFKWMSSLIPAHIPHPLDEEMKKKSDIFILPVSLNNETTYSDCVKIMDECSGSINRWYTKAGRGAHTATERFDHLHPIIVELFHTLQDFLEKMAKKFLNLQCGRDQGTLGNMKIQIQRSNVNGNVKSRYKAHEDFVVTCGLSYFLSYIMHHFNMATITDSPKHNSITEGLSNWTNVNKMKVFNTLMEEILTDLYIPFDVQGMEQDDSHEVEVTIQEHETLQCYQYTANVTDGKNVNIPLNINGCDLVVVTNLESLKKGCSLKVVNTEINVMLKMVEKNDDLLNYVKNFLQWFFIIVQMKDAVREGDVKRISIVLKNMIPFFYSHSRLSKYLTECIDYILKTEHTLSPYMSLKVQAGSVVNPKGRPGKNKAADIQKENEVKLLKTLIRSLGANKTEKSIVAITKAAPEIFRITENFESMIKLKAVKSSHKAKSMADDIQILLGKINPLDIWTPHHDRQLQQKVPRSPFAFDKAGLIYIIEITVKRLLRDLPVNNDEDEENEDE